MRRVARNALRAMGFSKPESAGADAREHDRLFDHRIVDSLHPPLSHYRE